jgi:rhodanese-related sulfurtransferase
VLAATNDPGFVIVNALGPQFHQGLEPSRYGRPGRIPGSINVPAASLVDPQSKTFPASGAAAKFAAAGVGKDRRVIAYCGGGISATVDLFLLHQLGFDDLTLYDGSMGEWAKDPALPLEKGWKGSLPPIAASASNVATNISQWLLSHLHFGLSCRGLRPTEDRSAAIEMRPLSFLRDQLLDLRTRRVTLEQPRLFIEALQCPHLLVPSEPRLTNGGLQHAYRLVVDPERHGERVPVLAAVSE